MKVLVVMQKCRSLAAFVILLGALFSVSIFSASASIQESVDAANPGDTITIAAGTYKENVHINKSLTIIGTGGDKTIVDGNRTGRVFTIGKGDPNIDVTLYGMLIRNGTGPSEYMVPNGIVDSVGSSILNRGTLIVDNCTIQDNGDQTKSFSYATNTYGGGIYSSGSLTVTQCTIINNVASYGGGIFLNNYENPLHALEAEITESEISGNSVKTYGGGIFNFGGGDLSITGTAISENGGNGLVNSGNLEMLSGTISGNRAYSSSGGGGVVNFGTFTMKGGTISDNIAYNGPAGTWYTGIGGGINNRGTLNLEGGIITGNHAYDGAGIYNGGTLFVGGTAQIISNGATGGRGGGIYSGNSLITFDGPGVVVKSNNAYLPSPSELSWYQGWGVYLTSGMPITTNGFDPATQVTGNTLLPARPPSKPSTPIGSAAGFIGFPHHYSTCASDPNGDQVMYTFDWDDGSTDTTSLVDSGITVSASHIWNDPGTYQVKAKATDSKGASSEWSSPLSVTMIAPIENIAVDLIVEKNAISETEQVPITVKVSSNSKPMPAEISLNINGKIVAGFSGQELTHLFGPSSVGSYDIMATASIGGLSERKPGKIEVIGDVSKTLELANDLSLAAHNEIYQSEEIAISRYIKSVIALGWIAANQALLNIRGMVNSLYPLEDYPATASFIDNFVSTSGEAIKFIEKSITDPIFKIFKKLGGDFSIEANIEKVEKDFNAFLRFINNNKDNFRDSTKFEPIFALHKTVIADIVETKEISNSLIGHTEYEQSCFYDNLNEWSEFISAIGVFTALAAGIIALSACGLALTCIIFVMSGFGPFLAGFLSFLSKLSLGLTMIKWTVSLSLLMTMPYVCFNVGLEHQDSIMDIEAYALSAVTGTPEISLPLGIIADNTLVGQATRISSNGQTFVVRPDGKISRLRETDENFITHNSGKYTVFGYQHNGKLFSNVASTTFNVFKPNITINASYVILNKIANINLLVKNNEESKMGNLTAILDIKNGTKNHVYVNGDSINLAAGESKNISYEVNLEDNDIYTARATVSQDFSTIVAERTFAIPIGISTFRDAAILDVTSKSEYSPHNNVTLNVTMQSYSPAFAFNISIPSLNYTEPVMVTGNQVMDIILPKLKPDYYTIGIVAEKDGKALDSRMVNFYVRADGVGLLTFNTSQILYKAGELAKINLSLKDLNLTIIDAQVGVSVRDPSGETYFFASNKTSDGYQFKFLPTTNGTYMLEAHASKEGWRIDNNTITVIVDRMSPLNMSVSMGEYILANVTANGKPAACNVTIYTPLGNESVITSNGLALFNATNQFYIIADKMFFEPAFYSYKPHSISGTKFNDTNSNGTRDPGEAGLSGWTIKLTRPDGTTINATTDANGAYKFENLTSGTYRVSEVRQSNWTQTYPAWLGDHLINVTDVNVTGVDFGNSFLPAPEIPFPPSGPASGIPGAEYSYSTSAADPNGYQISYTFDWGDGTNSTTGLFDSGAVASAAHIWNSSGVYQVRAMATNSKGASSEWSAALEVDIAAGIAADKIGVFRNGPWYIDYNGNRNWDPDSGDAAFWFGTGGDLPFAGDWSGDDVDEIGVFRNGPWYLDYNGNREWDPDSGDVSFWFGTGGDLPIAGDWNGDGEDEIGVFRNGPWYLDYNGNRVWDPASGDVSFWFGTSGDLPIAGDWNGDGRDEIGVFRNGPWYLDYNGNKDWDPASGDVSFWFGTSGDAPLAGDWNSDGKDEIGVFRNGPWYLDYNGNREWDPASGDVSFWFGTGGDRPVAGRWGSLSSSLAPDHDKPQLDLRETSAEKIRQKRAALEELQEERRNQVREIKMAQEVL